MNYEGDVPKALTWRWGEGIFPKKYKLTEGFILHPSLRVSSPEIKGHADTFLDSTFKCGN